MRWRLDRFAKLTRILKHLEVNDFLFTINLYKKIMFVGGFL